MREQLLINWLFHVSACKFCGGARGQFGQEIGVAFFDDKCYAPMKQ